MNTTLSYEKPVVKPLECVLLKGKMMLEAKVRQTLA